MKIEEKKIIYDDDFFASKSNDNTLKINDTSDVATNKNYHAIGNLKEDENYIFDSVYKPMYCTPSYDGCYQCVSSCVGCFEGCTNACQGASCYGGCVEGCNSGCQTCDGGCYWSCTDACQLCNNKGCVNSCNGSCQTCVGSCVGGCWSSCFNNCDHGCVSGCTSACQTCDGGCNGGCTSKCQDCVDASCANGCTSGCQNKCEGQTTKCSNNDGCSHCNSSVSVECATTVGCPDSLFNKNKLDYHSGCTICVTVVSCSAYVSEMQSACGFNDCGSLYGSCEGCRGKYSCSLYVACASSCMTCDASNFSCNASSCYSKVYKMA